MNCLGRVGGSEDAAGQVTAVTDPLGRQTAYTFDGAGRMTQLLQGTSYVIEGKGDIVNCLGRVGGSEDAAGNLTGVTDPIGRQTAFTFDAAGRQTQLRQGTNYVIDYDYDGAGQLLTLSGPAPNYANYPSTRLVTSYAYNERGQLISMSDNLGRLRHSTFNLAGEQVGFS